MGIETAILVAAAAAGTAVSYSAQKRQERQAEDMANYQQQQAADDAKFAASESQVQARMIRKAAEKQRAEARAALASSGVVVGEGTAEQIDAEIGADAEQDALMAVYDGSNRARQIRVGGDISAQRSRNAASAARIGATSALVSGASSIGSAWNTGSRRQSAPRD